MTRTNEIKCYLSDDELKYVQRRADRELIDPAMWMRRVAVSVADGRARVVVMEELDAAEGIFGGGQEGRGSASRD
jgi:hypothetical protein